MTSRDNLVVDDAVELREIVIPVERGLIRAKIYRPVSSTSTTALLWMHGGGFAGGSVDMPDSDAVSRTFARAGVTVLSVDYRLVAPLRGVRRWRFAPAIRFPIPIQDCLAAWRRLLDELARLDVSAERVLLGGASVGADLAVMSTLWARRAGLPAPDGVLLVYPLLHPVLPAPDADERPSLKRRLLRRVAQVCVRWMAGCFVGSAHADRIPEAFPRAADLDGFPPTLIVTSELDPLHTSGDAFARDLREHGVAVETRVETGARHGHLNRPGEPYFQRTMSALINRTNART